MDFEGLVAQGMSLEIDFYEALHESDDEIWHLTGANRLARTHIGYMNRKV